MGTLIHAPLAGTGEPIAAAVEPVVLELFDEPPPIAFEFWDGSVIGDDIVGRLRFTSPTAFRHIMWSPDELGLARAYVAGDVDVSGNVAELLRALQKAHRPGSAAAVRAAPEALRVFRAVGGVGTRPPIPDEEVVPRGVRHSPRRDRQAISHHYDVGNRFYELVLGPAMTYSCARFVTPDTSLADAQAAKHELICQKLGLAGGPAPARVDGDRPRPRLLDVGCGWGSMALHAATHHDVDVVGVTISDEQAVDARQRVADAGLADRIEIRVQDYRDVHDGPFDAISSIAAVATHRYMTPYNVSKAGLEMLVRQVADELGGVGIRANAVRPSLVPTDISAGLTAVPEIVDDYLEQMPLHRLGTTEDIASVVRFLAGPESSWITGVCISADGGHHLRRGPNLDGVMRMVFGDAVSPSGPST